LSQTVHKLPLEIGYYEKGEVLTNELYRASPFQITIESIKDSSIINKPIFLQFVGPDSFQLTYNGQVISAPSGQNQKIQTPYFDLVLYFTTADYQNSLNLENEYYFVINQWQ